MARKALGTALFQGVDSEFETSETLVVDVVDLSEAAGGRALTSRAAEEARRMLSLAGGRAPRRERAPRKRELRKF